MLIVTSGCKLTNENSSQIILIQSITLVKLKMYEKTFLKVKNIVIITQKRRHIFSFLFSCGKREIMYITRKGSKVEHTLSSSLCITR